MITRLILPLFACIILLSHCKPAEQKVTPAEASKFAADIEVAAIKHRPNFLTSNFILQALSDRMAQVKTVKYKGAVEKGVAQGLQKSDFDKNIYQILGKHGSFEKVKLYEKNGAQRIIFRAQGDGGLNYLDIELTKLADKVGIADILIYASGENISKSLADIIDKLMDASDASADETGTRFKTVKRLMQNDDYKAAKKEWDLLPADIKDTRVAQVMNVQIASNLDNETYMKEIAGFQSRFANDPYLQLMLLDLYTLREEYDKALDAINKIDALINKDPFLNYYRGLMLFLKGEKEKAMQYYAQVTASNPAFPGAYAELMALYVQKGDHENAKLYFTKYKTLRNSDDEIIHTYESAYPFLKE